MTENQLPPRDQINRYFDNINQGLATVPELKPALEFGARSRAIKMERRAYEEVWRFNKVG